MARQPRVEIEGGLYHVITRGNNRQTIFHSADDYGKFLSLLRMQKSKLPFFLYAYCMMSNHVQKNSYKKRVRPSILRFFSRASFISSHTKVAILNA